MGSDDTESHFQYNDECASSPGAWSRQIFAADFSGYVCSPMLTVAPITACATLRSGSRRLRE